MVKPMNEPKFKANVFDLAKSTRKTSSKGLEELVYRLSAYTGLNPEICDEVLSIFLDEILNYILEGNKMRLPFGRLLLNIKNNKFDLYLERLVPRKYVFKIGRNK